MEEALVAVVVGEVLGKLKMKWVGVVLVVVLVVVGVAMVTIRKGIQKRMKIF